MRLARIVCCIVIGIGIGVAVLPVGGASVTDLAWLAGCWQPDGGEAGSTEQWTAPAGGTMFGVSRTVKGGKTVAFEFLQIRERQDGRLEYVAHPSGQAETVFALLRSAGREVVFENPEHDYPQRIVYRLEENGGLKARIEGEIEGQSRTVRFPMHRIGCGS